MNSNFHDINVEDDRANPDGIFGFYQKLIALRQDLTIITDGDFALLDPDHPHIFAYQRENKTQSLFVYGNFTAQFVATEAPAQSKTQGRMMLSNLGRDHFDTGGSVRLAPFECFAWLAET